MYMYHAGTLYTVAKLAICYCTLALKSRQVATISHCSAHSKVSIIVDKLNLMTNLVGMLLITEFNAHDITSCFS